MARIATTQDIQQNSEDWVLYAQQGTLTNNKATTVIDHKVDTGEQFTVEKIGTNGGFMVKVRLQNKNDILGEEIDGFMMPFINGEPSYSLRIPYTFVSGDHIKLVATAQTSDRYNIKFAIKGHKIDVGL